MIARLGHSVLVLPNSGTIAKVCPPKLPKRLDPRVDRTYDRFFLSAKLAISCKRNRETLAAIIGTDKYVEQELL